MVAGFKPKEPCGPTAIEVVPGPFPMRSPQSDLQLRFPFYAANIHTLLTDNNPFGWPLKVYQAR